MNEQQQRIVDHVVSEVRAQITGALEQNPVSGSVTVTVETSAPRVVISSPARRVGRTKAAADAARDPDHEQAARALARGEEVFGFTPEDAPRRAALGDAESLRAVAAHAGCAEVDVALYARLGVTLTQQIRGLWDTGTRPLTDVLNGVKFRERLLRRELSQARKDTRALQRELKHASRGWGDAQNEVAHLRGLIDATAEAVLTRQGFLRVPRYDEQHPEGMDLAQAVAQGFDDLKAQIDRTHDDLRHERAAREERNAAYWAAHAYGQQVVKERDRLKAEVEPLRAAKLEATGRATFFQGQAEDLDVSLKVKAGEVDRLRAALESQRADSDAVIDGLRGQIADLKTGRSGMVRTFGSADYAAAQDRAKQMGQVLAALTFLPEDPAHIARAANLGHDLKAHVARLFPAQAAQWPDEPLDVLQAVAGMNARVAQTFADVFPAHMQDNGDNAPGTFDPASTLRRIAFDIEQKDALIDSLSSQLDGAQGARTVLHRLTSAAVGTIFDSDTVREVELMTVIEQGKKDRAAVTRFEVMFDDYLPATLRRVREAGGDHRVALAQYVHEAQGAFADLKWLGDLLKNRAAFDRLPDLRAKIEAVVAFAERTPALDAMIDEAGEVLTNAGIPEQDDDGLRLGQFKRLQRLIAQRDEARAELAHLDALLMNRAALDGLPDRLSKVRFALAELVRLQGVERQLKDTRTAGDDSFARFRELKDAQFPHLTAYGVFDGLKQGIHELRGGVKMGDDALDHARDTMTRHFPNLQGGSLANGFTWLAGQIKDARHAAEVTGAQRDTLKREFDNIRARAAEDFPAWADKSVGWIVCELLKLRHELADKVNTVMQVQSRLITEFDDTKKQLDIEVGTILDAAEIMNAAGVPSDHPLKGEPLRFLERVRLAAACYRPDPLIGRAHTPADLRDRLQLAALGAKGAQEGQEDPAEALPLPEPHKVSPTPADGADVSSARPSRPVTVEGSAAQSVQWPDGHTRVEIRRGEDGGVILPSADRGEL